LFAKGNILKLRRTDNFAVNLSLITDDCDDNNVAQRGGRVDQAAVTFMQSSGEID